LRKPVFERSKLKYRLTDISTLAIQYTGAYLAFKSRIRDKEGSFGFQPRGEQLDAERHPV